MTIWFVDIEKGRQDCRAYPDQRKLVRVSREAGLESDGTAHVETNRNADEQSYIAHSDRQL